jgi:hypothetical protein
MTGLVHSVRFQRAGKDPEEPAAHSESARGKNKANEMFARNSYSLFREWFGYNDCFFAG